MASERVTVTLPEEMVEEIDLRESNRSRFVQRAISHEFQRLREEELRQSLDNPHPDSREVAESGFREWAGQADVGDDELLDSSAGRGVRWQEERGWVEVDE